MTLYRLPRLTIFLLSLVVALGALSGCGSVNGFAHQAPVEDRGVAPSKSTQGKSSAKAAVAATGIGPSTAAQISAPNKTPLGIENEGKPGYYTVKQGDTLIRIGLENGQNWRDIAKWNQLDRPSQIEIGQVLRVVPPIHSAPVATTAPVPVPSVAPPVAVASTVPSSTVTASVESTPKPAAGDELMWAWPVSGVSLIAGFDETKNKGLDLAGKAGDAVLAAADGKVVYAGSSLRGYGNLIILKHNETFLSAYAHNQTLLVKEDQQVVKGQKLAEMGQTDTDRVKLHFEIRKQGKPVDPVQYLPKR